MPSPVEAALLAGLVVAPVLSPPVLSPPVPLTTVAARDSIDLKAILLKRLQAADAHETGVFHEDVTADVAPLFPAGQPFRETQRTVRTHGLGELKTFHGEAHEGTTMYVARSRLEAEMFGEVFVVLDFDFEGSGEQDLRLKRVTAFLHASNM